MIPVSVAPMMDRTDRHFRFFMRKITRRTLLYTEMVTTGAILHGDRDHLLGFSAEEHPISLQVGGDDPVALTECARIAEDRGYDEVNLNVGCPSSRVQKGSFGACLMARPERVAAAVDAMKAAVSIPVTVKHRIGIDDLDRYEDMLNFVDVVSSAGCRHFTVHARKAWLQGLSPKQNRNIPPLRYAEVHRLKRERPDLLIEINGGIRTPEQVHEHLPHVDAVMIGRGAVDDPMVFAALEQTVWDTPAEPVDRFEIARSMIPYIASVNEQGQPSHRVTRHMLQLFAGQPGAKAWKRHLSENGRAPGRDVVEGGLAAVETARDRLRTSDHARRLALGEAPSSTSGVQAC